MSHAAELPLAEIEASLQDRVRFSYSRSEDPLLRRLIVCGIELFTGQRFLRRSYQAWSRGRPANENIFAAGIRLLNIDLRFDSAALAAIPATGPLLVVANHPFGVADGLALGDIVTRVRRDTKIITHSLLCQPPEAADVMLPIDFGNTREAAKTSARSRLQAMEWLKDGHCVALFPGGGVATRQKPLRGPALDLPWHSFVAKLATVPGTRVVPLYFHGQNSTLFHLASHWKYALRIALLFRETMRHFGESIRVEIGRPVPGETLPHAAGKEAAARRLREMTFALAGQRAEDLAAEYIWPRRVVV